MGSANVTIAAQKALSKEPNPYEISENVKVPRRVGSERDFQRVKRKQKRQDIYYGKAKQTKSGLKKDGVNIEGKFTYKPLKKKVEPTDAV